MSTKLHERISPTPSLQIGLRVKLTRGCKDRDKQHNCAMWIGGEVYVGEHGTIALATKTGNELWSERARGVRFPDRLVVLWDKYGTKPREGRSQHTQSDFLAGWNHMFCISGNPGDPLPDYLAVLTPEEDDHPIEQPDAQPDGPPIAEIL